MKSLFFCVGIILIMSFAGFSQTPITPYQVDEVLLSRMIKERVDQLRQKKKLDPLRSATSLIKAAQNHADYLKEEPKIGHYQVGTRTPSPQDRVNKSGGRKFMAGENVVRGSFLDTYEATADMLVEAWRQSKGHYANIINDSYVYTGMAVSVNVKSGSVTAVQVFGTPKGFFPGYSPPRKKKQRIKREKLPYHIKGYKESAISQLVYSSGFMFSYGSIRTYSPEFVKKVFKYKKDGVVFESIARTPVSCTSANYDSVYARRNGNSSVDGFLSEPIYRDDLVFDENYKIKEVEYDKIKAKKLKNLFKEYDGAQREFEGVRGERRSKKRLRALLLNPYSMIWRDGKLQREGLKEEVNSLKLELTQAKAEKKRTKSEYKKKKKEKWDPTYWFGPLIEPAPIYDSIGEANLLVLRRNRIVAVLPCGRYCYTAEFTDSIPFQMELHSSSVTFIPDTIEFTWELGFESGDTLPDSMAIAPLLDSLDSYNISQIKVQVHASVEGNSSGNEELYRSRARSILRQLDSHLDSSTAVDYQAVENWKKFNQQIANPGFEGWQGLSNKEVQVMLLDSAKSERWKPLLYEQRKALISATAIGGIKDSVKYVYENYSNDTLETAIEIQNFLMQMAADNNWSNALVKKQEVSRDTSFAKLTLRKYFFEYYYGRYLEDGAFNHKFFYKSLLFDLKPKNISKRDLLVFLMFTLANWDDLYENNAFYPYKVHDLLMLYSEEITKENKDLIEPLWRIYFLKVMPHFRSYYQPKVQKYKSKNLYAEEALGVGNDILFDYYSKLDTVRNSLELTLQLSDFFAVFFKREFSRKILMNYKQVHGYEYEVDKRLLLLDYEHPDFDNGAYVRVLMDYYDIMGQDRWCELFEGDCRISFQTLNNRKFRDFYCEKCESR